MTEMEYAKLLYEREIIEKRLSKARRDYYTSIKKDMKRLNELNKERDYFIYCVHFKLKEKYLEK